MLAHVTRDETWGYILIFFGIVLLVWKPLNKLSGWLHGQTETAITALLFAVIMFYIVIAFFGKPETKAVALLWIVTP